MDTRRWRRGVTAFSVLLGAVIVTAWPLATDARGQTRAKTAPGRVLSGMDALRYLHGRRQFAKAEVYAYRILWQDIRQAEALWLLADSLIKQRKKDDAAVYLTLLLRVLAEREADSQITQLKGRVERQLAVVNKDFEALKAAYARSAAGKAFSSPEKVDDLWMTQVRADLVNLHGLYAWTLVGGRKDAKPDWIHNTQGVMHRSGAKYMAEVHGRRGVLFCVPSRKSKRTASVVWEGPQSGRVLRIGTRAYGFSYVLNVLVSDRQVFSRTVGVDSWADLRIPLDSEPAQPGKITLELVVPENQRWMEGLFFDYIDFFDN